MLVTIVALNSPARTASEVKLENAIIEQVIEAPTAEVTATNKHLPSLRHFAALFVLSPLTLML